MATFTLWRVTCHKRIRIDVHEILSGDNRAVILSSLASRLTRPGKIIKTTWRSLTCACGGIVRFQMPEDSFVVYQPERG